MTVQAKEDIRKELLEAYEKLHPAEQALLQLCSVIYEAAPISVLYKIFYKAGLSFPGEKINSSKALEPHLRKLRALKLLNDKNQVPPEIVEIVTRRAVAAGRILNAGDFFKGVESDLTWTDKLPAVSRCISCFKAVQGKAFIGGQGTLCPSCIELELKILSDDENVESWGAKRILDALSPGGDIKSRFAVILKSSDALRAVFSESRGDVETLYGLLVQHLGYFQPHPLAEAVRRAAVQACSRAGEPVLPLLLKAIRKSPWEYYANVLTAMGQISPENPEVKALLTEASGDWNPEVRRCVMALLHESTPAWAGVVIEKLSRDRDPAVRDMARAALLALKSKQGRFFSFHMGAYRSLGVPLRPSIRSGPLVRAVLEELPPGYPNSHVTACLRAARDFRICVYSRDREFFRRRLEALFSACAISPEYSNLIVRICNDPFDAAWFATLPLDIRMYGLSMIFYQAMFQMEPDGDALAYAMKNIPFGPAPQQERVQLLYYLASRFIMGGMLTEAQRIIPEIEGPDFSFGLMGWLRFVEGRNEEAIESFEADLKELRHRMGKRNINFRDLPGFFYILALLRSRNEDFLKRADQLVSWSLSPKSETELRASVYKSLKGIVHAQKLEMEEAKRLAAGESKSGGTIPAFFNAVLFYWVNGDLPGETVKRLDRIFHAAKGAGMNWLAMECAALLIRAGRETPMLRAFLDRVVKQSRMQPFVWSIMVEEPWEKGLRALVQIGSEPEGAIEKKSPAGNRLIWLIDYGDGMLSVHPMEQKLTRQRVDGARGAPWR